MFLVISTLILAIIGIWNINIEFCTTWKVVSTILSVLLFVALLINANPKGGDQRED